MSLSYRVTFLCNGYSKLIINQKVLYDTFLLKTCKLVEENTMYIKKVYSEFNAHRVFRASAIVEIFPEYELVEYSCIHNS